MSRGVVRVCAAMALLVVVAATGCGGGQTAGRHLSRQGTASAGSGGTVRSRTAKKTLRGAFVARADAICEAANHKLASGGSSGTSRGEIVRELRRNASLEHGTVTMLETLHPPASLQSDWTALLKYRRGLADQLEMLAIALQRNRANDGVMLDNAIEREHAQLLVAALRAHFQHCDVT